LQNDLAGEDIKRETNDGREEKAAKVVVTTT